MCPFILFLRIACPWLPGLFDYVTTNDNLLDFFFKEGFMIAIAYLVEWLV